MPFSFSGVLVAVLTAFYMFRLVFVVFFGPAKSDIAAHAMSRPRHALAAAEFWRCSALSLEPSPRSVYANQFDHSSEHLSFAQQLVLPFSHSPLAAVLGLLAAIAGFSGAYILYSKAAADRSPQSWEPSRAPCRTSLFR